MIKYCSRKNRLVIKIVMVLDIVIRIAMVMVMPTAIVIVIKMLFESSF